MLLCMLRFYKLPNVSFADIVELWVITKSKFFLCATALFVLICIIHLYKRNYRHQKVVVLHIIYTCFYRFG